MPAGEKPREIVAVTVLLVVFITEIEFDPVLPMYTVEPSRLTAVACGVVPTGMVAITELLAKLITETVLSCEFGM